MKCSAEASIAAPIVYVGSRDGDVSGARPLCFNAVVSSCAEDDNALSKLIPQELLRLSADPLRAIVRTAHASKRRWLLECIYVVL